MKPSFFSPILSLSLVPSLRVENLGRRGRGKKREGKTFHPSFIHVITSISISRRISNSLVPVCTYSRIYAQGYKDVCIRGCGAGCKHKGGEGARGRATWKHREGGGCRVYIRTSRVPRYETHWTSLSLARANSRTVETVCPANWFSLASSIRRNRVHATRCCVHPPLPPPPLATRRQAWSSIDRCTTG